MTRTLRIEIWLMALLLQAIAPALAQQMSVKAPRQVFEGENFRVAYTVDSKEVENSGRRFPRRLGSCGRPLCLLSNQLPNRWQSCQFFLFRHIYFYGLRGQGRLLFHSRGSRYGKWKARVFASHEIARGKADSPHA